MEAFALVAEAALAPLRARTTLQAQMPRTRNAEDDLQRLAGPTSSLRSSIHPAKIRSANFRSAAVQPPARLPPSGTSASGPGGPSGPNGPNGPPTGPDEEGDLAVEQVRKTQKPKRYKVVFHNDDYTTREFVIEVLMRFFDKDESEATFIMLSVHHKGSGVAGLYPRDVAETKVAQVTKHARASGMPLRLTAEPE